MEKIGDLAIGEKEKKALSPVIATVLLIALAVILILIILLLFRGFIKEVVEKNGQPAEYSCEDVNLEVGRSGTKLDIVNKGNVPVLRIAVKKIKLGASDTVYPAITQDIAPGGTREDVDIGDVSVYTKINVIPILRGNTKGGAEKEYQCPDKYGEIIVL